MNSGRGEVLDELLVIRCQGGDVRALELLARRWHPRLLRDATYLTGDAEAARDVAQEAWIGIARGVRRLQDPARFRSWAHRIVVHKSRDWIRRERTKRRTVQRAAADLAEGPAAAQPRDDIARLRAALAELPADQRTVLSWFYLEEMSVREIAAALSIPAGTVKSRLYHARNALRSCLKEDS
jgi:RNA polymerase sigma-70 factor (ECF subfamily)